MEMDLWRRWWSLEKQSGGREVLIAIGSSPVVNILCIIIIIIIRENYCLPHQEFQNIPNSLCKF